MRKELQDILKLRISERILLVEAIWDSIAEKEETIGLSEDTKHLLDERLNAHKENPNEGSSWEEVKAHIENK